MKSFKSFSLLSALSLLGLLLTGCEILDEFRPDDDPYIQGYSNWQTHTAAPIQWRLYEHGYLGGGGYSKSIEIMNTASSKLHIVGLATSNSSIPFVDLSQPGTFNITLYPGQKATAALVDGGVRSQIRNATAYLKIQDYSLEQ